MLFLNIAGGSVDRSPGRRGHVLDLIAADPSVEFMVDGQHQYGVCAMFACRADQFLFDFRQGVTGSGSLGGNIAHQNAFFFRYGELRIFIVRYYADVFRQRRKFCSLGVIHIDAGAKQSGKSGTAERGEFFRVRIFHVKTFLYLDGR